MQLPVDISSNILLLVKAGIVLFMGLYCIFAWVIVRQAKLMAQTILLEFDASILKIVYAHLFFSFLVLLGALIIL